MQSKLLILSALALPGLAAAQVTAPAAAPAKTEPAASTAPVGAKVPTTTTRPCRPRLRRPPAPATDATATDTATPSDAATAPAAKPQTGAVAKATQADLKAGAPVSDVAGASVGKIETADAEGAVVATGKVRAKLPLASFGKDAKGGIVISMSKAELEAAANQGS